MNVRHFVFSSVDDRGRFAIAIDDDAFEYRQLSGRAPRPEHLIMALTHCPEWIVAMNAAADHRRNPCSIERRNRMSGAVDLLLREHRAPEWGNYPIRARLHISMRRKLNESFRMWLGDCPAMLDALIDYGDFGEVAVWPVEIYRPDSQAEKIRLAIEDGQLVTETVLDWVEEEPDDYIAWHVLERLQAEEE